MKDTRRYRAAPRKRLSSVITAVTLLWCASLHAQLSANDIATLRAQAKSDGWTFTVGETSATAQPIEDLAGLVPPPDWRDGAPFTIFAEKADLPAAFNWETLVGCPAVRNQGNCGSCWAFGTVGPLECSILIRDRVEVDLSEQWLVSCNQETELPQVLGDGVWGCDGGWFAHAYHTASGEKTDACGGYGAVLEEDFPYATSDVSCDCPYPPSYTVASWAYVGPEEGVADTEAIKQAIYRYGPVSAAVYVDSAFQSYDNGVFNASTLEEVNHAVVLVGWDDNQGANGVWILRNSWGPSLWGEGGYMRIEYGCSNIGYGACYADYAGGGFPDDPAIVHHPQSKSVPPGMPCALSVLASGAGDLHYQWLKDGQSVGNDAPEHWITAADPEDAGSYTCQVTDARGSSISAAAVLSLDTSATVPVSGRAPLLALTGLCVLTALLTLHTTR